MSHRSLSYYRWTPGGTHSRSLSKEVFRILTWAERNLYNVRASCIPAFQNQLADLLSRDFADNNEWSLNQQEFQWICQEWGDPQIDPFVSPPQHQDTPILHKDFCPGICGERCCGPKPGCSREGMPFPQSH